MAQDILFGIDYGSKLSGNTVIAVLQGQSILFLAVEPKVDADAFVLNAAEHFKPIQIFLDAPLSLPGVYRQMSGFSNYHFRRADQECRAMSPMFLGGLAARAMELKGKLEAKGSTVFETYPRLMANRCELSDFGYKSSKSAIRECGFRLRSCLQKSIHLDLKELKTWHHVDALLALMSAMAYQCGKNEVYGDPEEGQIFV